MSEQFITVTGHVSTERNGITKKTRNLTLSIIINVTFSKNKVGTIRDIYRIANETKIRLLLILVVIFTIKLYGVRHYIL